MDLSVAMKSKKGPLFTMAMSFNNKGPFGGFYRYIGEEETYKVYRDSMTDSDGNEVTFEDNTAAFDRQDIEFVGAIREGREPESSAASVVPTMALLDKIDKAMSGDLTRRVTEEIAMGEIVAALGTCHTPYLFTRPPDENAQQLDQAAAAIQELGKALDESKPDVILMFGADHVETFSVTCVPSSPSSPATAPSPSSPGASTTCRSIARWPRTSSTSWSSTTTSTWPTPRMRSSGTPSRSRSSS